MLVHHRAQAREHRHDAVLPRGAREHHRAVQRPQRLDGPLDQQQRGGDQVGIVQAGDERRVVGRGQPCDGRVDQRGAGRGVAEHRRREAAHRLGGRPDRRLVLAGVLDRACAPRAHRGEVGAAVLAVAHRQLEPGARLGRRNLDRGEQPPSHVAEAAHHAVERRRGGDQRDPHRRGLGRQQPQHLVERVARLGQPPGGAEGERERAEQRGALLERVVGEQPDGGAVAARRGVGRAVGGRGGRGGEQRHRLEVAGPRVALDVVGARRRAGAAGRQRRRGALVRGEPPGRRRGVVDRAADQGVAERERAPVAGGAHEVGGHEAVERRGRRRPGRARRPRRRGRGRTGRRPRPRPRSARGRAGRAARSPAARPPSASAAAHRAGSRATRRSSSRNSGLPPASRTTRSRSPASGSSATSARAAVSVSGPGVRWSQPDVARAASSRRAAGSCGRSANASRCGARGGRRSRCRTSSTDASSAQCRSSSSSATGRSRPSSSSSARTARW